MNARENFEVNSGVKFTVTVIARTNKMKEYVISQYVEIQKLAHFQTQFFQYVKQWN